MYSDVMLGCFVCLNDYDENNVDPLSGKDWLNTEYQHMYIVHTKNMKPRSGS